MFWFFFLVIRLQILVSFTISIRKKKEKKQKTKTKQNKRSPAKSNIVYNKDFTFYKYHDINDFDAKNSPDLKLTYLKDFKPNNEHQIEDLEKRRFAFEKAHESCNKFLNIYKTVHKKWTEAQNMSEKLSIDSYLDEDEDNLTSVPELEGNEKVKLEPEETIAERVKLNPSKRWETGTGLKILTPINY